MDIMQPLSSAEMEALQLAGISRSQVATNSDAEKKLLRSGFLRNSAGRISITRSGKLRLVNENTKNSHGL